MTKEQFVVELMKLNIQLDDDKLNKLDMYYKLLKEWNEKINLTSITEENDVYLKHFYDCLTLIKCIDLNQNLNVLDVGTGAGFPGIVLKIIFPNLKITLLDSLNKRIIFLNEVIKKINLKDIETVCSRAEDYSKNNREQYDLVVSRAVAHLRILVEISLACVKVNGYLIAMKSEINEEKIESIDTINKMGGKIERIEEFLLPYENSKRNLVMIRKIEKTNLKYPRRYSEIKKEKNILHI